MFTKIKTTDEIKAMRVSGKILASVLQTLAKKITSGMTTKDLSEIAKRELKPTGGLATFLGYSGFPDVLCVSVNDEIVHGIPRKTKIIQSGDLVSLDFGVTYDGMITDSAISVIVDHPRDPQDQKLLDETKKSLEAGMSVVKDGVNIGAISFAIQKVLERGKYGIVRDLVGHGVGHELHEDPNIPNYGNKLGGPILHSGMTIAIEPMATLGTHKVVMDPDGWTIRTADGSTAAHFEHTILIQDKSFEILTKV